MNDYQIIQRLKSSDSHGLEQLFQKHYTFLTKIAFYITGDREIAEDLAQDLFVKIWERRDSLPDITNVKGYLTKMIRNSALDHMESRQSGNKQLEQFLYFNAEITNDSQDSLEELKGKLSKAMSHLPPKCRLIFSLNRFEGLTNDEIAEYLELSKRTVETQISKALRILRAGL